MKKHQEPIPKTPKFQDRKMLYRVVDWSADSMFDGKFVEDLWLTHSEVTMLLLQGREIKLIQTR
jgi:hypothetical protein